MSADVELQRQPLNWEPWKALATAFGAGAAFTGAVFAIIVVVVRHL